MGRDPDDLLSVKDAQALAENWLEHNMGRRLEPFQQGMQQIYNMSIGGLEAASRQEHPSVWKRWGPEVREIIERRKQTKFIDNSDYEEAISIVRGKHADELVQERLEQEMKNTMTTESTRGGNAPFGPGSRGSDDFDELPPQLLERFSRAGITREQIRKTASAMGISEERWIEMYKNGDYVFDDNKVYRKVTEDK